MTPRKGHQPGFAIVSSVFVVVVLSVLGVYMATMSGVQQATTSETLMASRAYYGAKAGLEWGVHRAIAAGGTCLASTTFALAGPGFDGVSVTVTCNAQTHAGVYYITSQAEFGVYGASPGYIRRRMEATVANF